MKALQRSVIVIVFALFAASLITACETMESLGDYFQDNPVFVSMTARQLMVRYIEKEKTEDAQKAKAIRVDSRLNLILVYMNGNPLATVDSLMDVVNDNIDWGKLTKADRLLVQDMILLVKNSLLKGKDGKTLPPETMLSLRELLSVMRSAVALFL